MELDMKRSSKLAQADTETSEKQGENQSKH